MSPLATCIDVNRPAGDVFVYATDPARFCEKGYPDHGSNLRV